MPRFFVSTTSDRFHVDDHEGVALPNTPALAKVLRQTLATMLHDEGSADGCTEVRANAVDERGRCVMSAAVRLTIAKPD